MAEVDLRLAPPATMPEDRGTARSRAVVFHVAWLVPYLLVYAWFFSSQFQGLVLPEAMEAAQVGQHISNGKGFTTSVVRPLSLAIAPRVNSHPDLYDAPLHPLVLAVALNLLGSNDRAVGLVSALFGLLTVLMAYLLGARLLNQRAGALAALLACLNLGLLKASVSGLGITLLAFLLVLLFYLVSRHRGTLAWSALCGAVAALCYLTDYAALLLAVAAAGLLFFSQRAARLRHVALFAVAFTVVALPWLVRTWAATGSPIGGLKAYSVAMYGTSYPLTNLHRQTSASGLAAWSFAPSHYREVAKKLLLGLGTVAANLPNVLGLYLAVLLGLALFVDLRGEAANRLKWAVIAGAVLLAFSVALGQPRYDVFYGLLGIVAALGGGAFLVALEAGAASRRAIVAATAALLALSAYPVALMALPGARPARPDRRNLDYLSRALPANAIILTDQPWAVAWYSKRTALLLPQAPPPRPPRGQRMSLAEAADATLARSYKALESKGVKPSAIYLSAELPRYPSGEGIGRWQLLYDVIAKQLEALQRGQVQGEVWLPPGWTLAATLPPGDFLLLPKTGK